MRNKNMKKLVVAATVFAMGVTSILPSSQVQAAKVKKLSVKTKKITLYKGAAAGYGSTKLKVTVKPKKAKVTYKVSNKKVASVTKKGLVKAKKVGKTNVIVKAGSKKVTVKVVVKKIKKKVTKVTATKSITVAVGEKQKIKTSVKPAKATLKTLTFATKNKKVAKVSAKGAVTGVAEGSTKVVVKAVDGSKKKATVAVVVSGSAVSTAATTPAVVATTPAVATASNAPAGTTTAPSGTDATKAPGNAGDATEAPSGDATEAPSGDATEAPSGDTTAAPSGDTTAAPSGDATAAPSGDTTAAPSGNTTAAPSTTKAPVATFEPVRTIDPSATGVPVEAKSNGDGTSTVSFNVASGGTLRINFTKNVASGSALSNIEINADSLKLMTFVTDTLTSSSTATGAAATFAKSEAATYGGIAVTKKADDSKAEVKVSETKSYNMDLKTTDEKTGEVALTLENPDTGNSSVDLKATAKDDGTYTVKDLSVGGQTASGDFTAKVDATDDGTQKIEMKSESGDTYKVTYDAAGNFDYTAPDDVLAKYGIEAKAY
jgi:hypothetical protein